MDDLNTRLLSLCSSLAFSSRKPKFKFRGEKNKFPLSFLSSNLMIDVNLQINSWLCNVIDSWINSSCLACNKIDRRKTNLTKKYVSCLCYSDPHCASQSRAPLIWDNPLNVNLLLYPESWVWQGKYQGIVVVWIRGIQITEASE